MQRIILLLFILMPLLHYGQTVEWGTPEHSRIINEDCDGKTFKKYEQLATFNIPKQAFEDSLTSALKLRNAFTDSTTHFFGFLLTKKSRMLSFYAVKKPFPKPEFMEAFLSLSYLWEPPKQNGLEVCGYVKCEVIVKNGHLTVTVSQETLN